MHQRKYFTLNFFINEIFSVENFPNYGNYNFIMYVRIIWVCAVAPLCCISHTTVLHSNKSKSKSTPHVTTLLFSSIWRKT